MGGKYRLFQLYSFATALAALVHDATVTGRWQNALLNITRIICTGTVVACKIQA